MMTTTLYVATNLDALECDSPGDTPGDTLRDGTVFRRLDPEYYAWLRSRMTLAKQAMDAGRIPRPAFEALRARFNDIHVWAIEHLGEAVLLSALKTSNPAAYAPPARPTKTPAADFPADRCVVIESAVLGGERIVIALEDRFVPAARAQYPDLAVYSPSEIEELDRTWNGEAEFVRKVHAVKKAFNGLVLPISRWPTECFEGEKGKVEGEIGMNGRFQMTCNHGQAAEGASPATGRADEQTVGQAAEQATGQTAPGNQSRKGRIPRRSSTPDVSLPIFEDSLPNVPLPALTINPGECP
ncbi:MAG: hypothetical protein V1918_05640 [Planctomycetota bacterium]